MRCTVYNKKRSEVVICVLLFFFALVFRSLPRFLEIYDIRDIRPICYLISTVFSVSSLYVLMRRLAVLFEYEICERAGMGEADFAVYRMRGEKAKRYECVLPMSSLVFCAPVCDRNTLSAAKEKFSDMNFTLYDYTVTFRGDFLLLVFEDGYEYSAILIEPSEVMRNYFLSMPHVEN